MKGIPHECGFMVYFVGASGKLNLDHWTLVAADPSVCRPWNLSING